MTAREAWNKTYDVNVTGTHVLTTAMAPLLIKGRNPRLLFLTSGLASQIEFADPSTPRRQVPEAGWPKQSQSFISYRTTKSALNMLMLDWQRLLEKDRVKVWSVSPGLLLTGLGNNPEFMRKIGAAHPSIGGEFIRDIVAGKRDADVGKVVRDYSSDKIQPW